MQISINTTRGICDPSYVKWKKIDCMIEQMPTIIQERIWSPCVWENDRRSSFNFLRSDYLTYDFDSHDSAQPKDIVDQLKERLKPVTYIIGASKSHSDAEPSLRIIIPIEKVLIALYYTYNQRYYAEKLFDGLNYDPIFDAARLWYPCKRILTANNGKALRLKAPSHEFVLKITQQQLEKQKNKPLTEYAKRRAKLAIARICKQDSSNLALLFGKSKYNTWLKFMMSVRESGECFDSILSIVSKLGRDEEANRIRFNSIEPNSITIGTLLYFDKELRGAK